MAKRVKQADGWKLIAFLGFFAVFLLWVVATPSHYHTSLGGTIVNAILGK